MGGSGAVGGGMEGGSIWPSAVLGRAMLSAGARNSDLGASLMEEARVMVDRVLVVASESPRLRWRYDGVSLGFRRWKLRLGGVAVRGRTGERGRS